MSNTLLDYLTMPNPLVDNTHSKTGSNTDDLSWLPIEGVRDWDEFKNETLLSCYGELLEQTTTGLGPVPVIESFPHCEIWDEDSLEALLVRWNLSVVSTGLSFAHRLCGSGWKEGGWNFQEIFMARGGLASLTNDRRVRPDWAGIQQGRLGNAIVPTTERRPYLNLCPGDTKLSTKWKSLWSNTTVARLKEEFNRPMGQILNYCSKANSRYGYILTQEELVVVRVTMSTDPIKPLSTSRPRRATAQYQPSASHARNYSITSALSDMSLDAPGSSYTDGGNPTSNYDVLEIRSIPWTNQHRKMTVNLGLWWIHMMAKEDNSIQISYPPLHSWTLEQEPNLKPRYRHNTSGRCTYEHPEAATIIDSRSE
ncbi:MAG: hypothetical protein M1840_000566 [Geoglossum simile]|nr:MAG: hypothetical protein M1840_000566 [Geoglossum simile]